VQKKATRVEQRAYSNQAHTLVLCAADIRFACMKDFVHGIMATALVWSVFQERAPKKKKKKIEEAPRHFLTRQQWLDNKIVLFVKQFLKFQKLSDFQCSKPIVIFSTSGVIA
jgi:hypothetical protein